MLRPLIPALMLRAFTMLWKASVSAALLHDFWSRGVTRSSLPVGWMMTQRISPGSSDSDAAGDQFQWLRWRLLKNAALCSSGSDKEAILDLVTSRSNAQRQEVIAAYKSNFGKVQEYISYFCLLKSKLIFQGLNSQTVTCNTFRLYVFIVSTGPDWGSEVWADGQIWAPHRQSDENPCLPRCQRNPRRSQSKTFTS